MLSETDLIEEVKTKMEEISPFDEPDNFIVAGGDASYDKVKAIVSYIKQELPNAISYCLSTLPLSLLAADVKCIEVKNIHIDKNCVGILDNMYDWFRYARVSVPEYWRRDVTSFLTSSDAMYLVEQHPYVGSGACKPKVVVVPELGVLELHSFPGHANEDIDTEVNVYYINPVVAKVNDDFDIESAISDYISLRCAECVYNIFGMQQSAIMAKMFNEKVTSVLL